VLEVLFAAYASAAEKRRVDLPFATRAERPIDLWKGESQPVRREPGGGKGR
jgi:hypothetical protein